MKKGQKMKTITLNTHIGKDGILNIELPTNLKDVDVELVLVYHVASSKWPVGYFEETYGSFADEPLERPEQGEFEEREELL
jgi:hypothetical protein